MRLLYFISLFLFIAGCKNDVIPEDTGYQQYGTPFAEVPGVEEMIMYEVNLRAYSVSGDLSGVIADLDRLAAMHINTLWLMPIYAEGVLDAVHSPYCIQDYKKVSPEYGTLDDLRTLCDEAHARGIAVVLDWVANHTSWDHTWMANPDWYTQNASGEIISPPGTNWYDVADLNFANADMRAAMIDAMRYWVLEANIDGYRCDYADGVPAEFWQQAIDSLRAIPNREIIMLAEGSYASHYTAGFDMTYSWDYYGTLQEVFAGAPASDVYSTNNAEYADVPFDKALLRFTTNHDESAWNTSPINLFGGESGALAASAMTIFMRGVPLIYTGQETGRVTNTPFFSQSPIDWTANPDMQLAYTEMLTVYDELSAARTGAISTYSHPDVFCIKKTSDTEFVVLVNTRNTIVSHTLPTPLKNSNWTNAIDGTAVSLGTEIVLDPYAYLLLRR